MSVESEPIDPREEPTERDIAGPGFPGGDPLPEIVGALVLSLVVAAIFLLIAAAGGCLS